MTMLETKIAANGESAWRRLLAKDWAGVAVLVVFYACLIVGFSVLSPFFLTVRNMLNIGSNMAFIGLMAAVGTPVMIAGGLDLSVAAVAGLSGVVVAILHAAGLEIWTAVLVAFVVGAVVGAINGYVSTYIGINPFIATLATMSIVSGLAKVMTSGRTRPLLEDNFNWIGAGRLYGWIPVPLILMVLAFILIWAVLHFSRFGRYVFASGGNAEASRTIGVPVDATLMKLYVLSGFGGALAGVVLAATLGAAGPAAADAHLLTVIAAIILGGTSLSGGRGSIWGTLLAVLILGTLNNGLTILDVSSFWQDVTRGAVLLAAVGLDQLRTRATVD
jgi:ribose transport system permease protein